MTSASTFKRGGRETRNLKENENLGPPEKKRRVSSRNASKARNQTQEVLCPSNGQADNCAEVPEKFSRAEANGKVDWEEGRMASEYVDALLNTKILGKSKFDLKGKNEQMTDHIKKLRACIRQFLQVETAYVIQIEQLQNQLKEERIFWEKSELSMREKQEKLAIDLSGTRDNCASLAKELAAAEEEKSGLILVHEKDVNALQASQTECLKLQSEVEKMKMDSMAADEKVKSLQDINKRLSEYNTSLQAYNSKLQSDATNASQENSKLHQEKLTILETLSTVRGTSAALQAQLDTSKLALQEESRQKSILAKQLEQLQAEFQLCMEERSQCQSRIQSLLEENNRFRDFTGKSASELEAVTSKAVALEESHSCQAEHIKNLQQQLDTANLKLQTLELTLEMHKKAEAEYHVKEGDLQQRLIEAEQRLNEGEIVRRKLHNTIQELKGNIRVFCRVRPLLVDDEDIEQVSPVVQYPQFGELFGRGIDLVEADGKKFSFSFDKVFGPDTSQENVFEEISQLVQSALDGYKVCIFAYGQTGSGKTYTMLGQPGEPNHKGLIPRSLEQIFKSSQLLENQGWKFKMQASMLEIYNETIRDLLVTPRSDAGLPPKQPTLKHDSMGNTVVVDLMLVEVTSWREVSTLLHQAAQSRTVGRTAMNENSSRSHCVFTLRIVGVNESTEQQVHGVLNLVDLAGSERLSRTGAIGDRLKETQAINKSLSNLGDVILAIANKEQHIPYRNSKLTHLLQPCLGGDSKTLMFVNISPDSKSCSESLCSLRFAAKVNACEIGVPRRQTYNRGAEPRLSNS